MRLVSICAGIALIAAAVHAQPSPRATETKTIGGKTITITYSSPRVKGREGKLFGPDGLISHDQGYPVWRAGANAATVIESSGDLNIGWVAVPAGKHSLFVDIKDPNAWVLIVNKQTGQSGLEYDAAQDLGRAKMTMTKPSKPVEELKYTISDLGGNKGRLTLEWENHAASVPITVK